MIKVSYFFYPLKIISLSSILFCWKKYDLANGVAQGYKPPHNLFFLHLQTLNPTKFHFVYQTNYNNTFDQLH
jgi:hypothetical protein